MFQLLVLCYLPLAFAQFSSLSPPGCGQRFIQSSRIVGGSPAAQGEFPWYARLERNGSMFCGASILDSLHILTAAHCTVGQTPQLMKVIVGTISLSSGGTSFGVKTMTVHPSFNSQTLIHDVAVWTLTDPIDLAFPPQTNTQPTAICYPAATFRVATGQALTAIGHGTTSENGQVSPTLLKVTIHNLGAQSCSVYKNFDDIDQICAGEIAGGKDTCQGDSGGPLTMASAPGSRQEVQAGSTSFGNGCARAGNPGVYAALADQESFVRSIVLSTPSPPPAIATTPPKGSGKHPRTPPHKVSKLVEGLIGVFNFE